MITKVDSSNFELYAKLFQDAENLLCGFKEVKTFDYDYVNNGGFYYIRENRGVFSKLISDDTGTSLITDLQSFATELGKYKDAGGIFKRILTDDQVKGLGYAPTNGITTLEEYFSWLGTIKNIDDDFANKYIELPLDEPHFTIDANTRAITIPSDFRKNGISVQGDNLAEVVYFEIDRFYDYMDFNNCEIYIQWEVPKATTPTVSTAYNKTIYHDTTKDRDILVFGWAISDALTAQTGNLKFSVIFYQTDEEGKVVYRFNTLTATASIKASMVLDIQKGEFEIDDIGSRLKDRITNSAIVGGYEAKYPVFVLNLEDREYDIPEDEVLSVEAKVSDTGAISYLWTKVPYGTDGELNFNGKITGLSGTPNYEAIEGDYASSSIIDPTLTYYVKKTDSSNYIELSVAGFSKPMTSANLLAFNDSSNGYDGKVYRYVSTYAVDTAGLYYAEATNRLTAAAATTASNSALFPCPQKAKNAVLSFGEGSNGIITDEDGFVTLTVTGKIAEKNEPKYSWYRSENPVEGVAPNWIEITDYNDKEYVATDKGYYSAWIKTTRNNVSTSTQAIADSGHGYLRVTGPAVAAEITLSNPRQIDQNELSADNCFAFSITNDLPENRDKYLVDWYVFQEDINVKIEGVDESGNIVTASKESGDEDFFKFNPADYTDIIKKLTGDDNIIAYYYPVVTTVLNGDKKVAKSAEKFEVTTIQNEDIETESLGRIILDDSKLFFETED